MTGTEKGDTKVAACSDGKDAAEEWNERNPVGTEVIFDNSAYEGRAGHLRTRTASNAWLLLDGTAVIRLSHIPDLVMLRKVKAID